MAYYLFNFTKKGADKSRPLREQAAELLVMKLWGIGENTANRNLLASGDYAIAYVGAPEKVFIGHGTLSSGVHVWTPEEAARYLEEGWPEGVSFGDTEVWEHPVALAAAWPKTSSATTNPAGRFFGGVVRIKKEDYETILAERTAGTTEVTGVEAAEGSGGTPVPTSTTADQLYAATGHLRKFLAQGSQPLSEDATRALFINKYLDALGYTEFGDVDYGVQVESGDFADYVLHVGDQAELVLEAKKLRSVLGPKEAAQVVKYASVLGVRWGVVTDGRFLKVYDPRVPNVTSEDRLVFEVDLAGYSDREDFEVRIYPDLALLSKEEMLGDGLERRAAQEAVRELLTAPESNTVAALRDELKQKKLIHLDVNELAEVLSHLLN